MKQEIIIKENGVMVKEFCAICGDTMKNTSPLGLFTNANNQPVCRECAEGISPCIIKALRAFYNEEHKDSIQQS